MRNGLQMVRATSDSGYCVQDAPKVLVLQLKRFEYSVYSRHKVTKKVDYQTTLDLGPFMSRPGAGRLVRFWPCMPHRARLQR